MMCEDPDQIDLQLLYMLQDYVPTGEDVRPERPREAARLLRLRQLQRINSILSSWMSKQDLAPYCDGIKEAWWKNMREMISKGDPDDDVQ